MAFDWLAIAALGVVVAIWQLRHREPRSSR
jgi:hypothetical protein